MRNWLAIGMALSTLATVSVLPVGCSSTPAVPFQTVTDFCSEKAKQECQVAATCAIDATTCQTVRAQQCNVDASKATSGGTRQYYQPNAQACITKVQQAYQGASKVAYSDLYGTGSIDDLCNRVFQGTADKNQACQSNYDCTSSRICTPATPGGTSKVCADPAPKNSGDFCSDPGSVCATGSYCAVSGSGAAQCKARPDQGQACSAAAPCLESLHCVGGTCAMRVAIGQTCNPNEDPSDPNADCGPNGPYCDTFAGDICTIGLTFATNASDCKAFAGQPPPIVDAGGQDTAVAPTDSGTPGDAASGG